MNKKVLLSFVVFCILFVFSGISSVNGAIPSESEVKKAESIVKEVYLNFNGKTSAVLELSAPSSSHQIKALYMNGVQKTGFTTSGGRLFITINKSDVIGFINSGASVPCSIYTISSAGNTEIVEYEVYCYN